MCRSTLRDNFKLNAIAESILFSFHFSVEFTSTNLRHPEKRMPTNGKCLQQSNSWSNGPMGDGQLPLMLFIPSTGAPAISFIWSVCNFDYEFRSRFPLFEFYLGCDADDDDNDHNYCSFQTNHSPNQTNTVFCKRSRWQRCVVATHWIVWTVSATASE